MEYLADILEKEAGVYSNYLDLAIKKKQALIENDVDILESITDEEKSLSTKVLALEAARLAEELAACHCPSGPDRLQTSCRLEAARSNR